ncbi:hypothetical protein Tco_0162416 [Tanacetum coccineum]
MVVDDETRESLRGTIAILMMEEMEKQTNEMRNATVVDKGPPWGEDIKGWMYKCEQFFRVDNVQDDQKVPLISIHLFDIALVWHR